MKFSESWLREWVNVGISSEELLEQLTLLGLEVDDSTPMLIVYVYAKLMMAVVNCITLSAVHRMPEWV